MKWLLNDWSQIESNVVQTWSPPKRPKSSAVPPRLARKVSFAAGALLAVSVFMPGLHVNSPSFAVSISGLHGISSAVEASPPLESFFGGRFAGSWTPVMEESLLKRFAEKSADSQNHLSQVVETIYFNQLEDPDSDARRLDRDQIATIVHKKNHA
jgi:hypothetical protein